MSFTQKYTEVESQICIFFSFAFYGIWTIA